MPWRRPPLLDLGPPLLATCLIGASVEFGWAAGEAVLVPLLRRHRVEDWVASTIYLANPTLGLWLQPRLGAYSDATNRRVPLVVALSSTALVGIAILASAVPLSKVLDPILLDDRDGEIDDDARGVLPPVAVAAVFLGFAAADICLDCLLIPGRALVDDVAAPAGLSDGGHAAFGGFQMAGRLLALLLGSSEFAASGLGGLYKDRADARFDACFTMNAAFLTVTTLAVVILVKDRGATYQSIPEGAISSELESEERQPAPASSPQTNGNLRNDSSDDGSTSKRRHCRPDATSLLFAVQAAGWIGVCAQSFFWTSWRGEDAGCADLALQSAVGMATSALLPFANARLGPADVWLASELSFHVLMASIYTLSESGGVGAAPRAIAALSGINYAVHATNALAVATILVPDPDRRARTIATVNNALPAGQLVAALTGGTIAQRFGGFEYALVCYGVLGALVTGGAWVVSSRRGLFSRSGRG